VFVVVAFMSGVMAAIVNVIDVITVRNRHMPAARTVNAVVAGVFLMQRSGHAISSIPARALPGSTYCRIRISYRVQVPSVSRAEWAAGKGGAGSECRAATVPAAGISKPRWQAN
jgi:hypothetical protein